MKNKRAGEHSFTLEKAFPGWRERIADALRAGKQMDSREREFDPVFWEESTGKTPERLGGVDSLRPAGKERSQGGVQTHGGQDKRAPPTTTRTPWPRRPAAGVWFPQFTMRPRFCKENCQLLPERQGQISSHLNGLITEDQAEPWDLR